VLQWRIEAGIQLGQHDRLTPQLRSLTAEHPLREAFHGQLMLALFRSGRQAEALAAYRAARGVLVGELGIEPGPELRLLHERIIAGDRGLLATPGSGSGHSARRDLATGAAPPAPAQMAEHALQAPVPRQLPPPVADFTGRSAELAALSDLLAAMSGAAAPAVLVAAIGGTAGVGKTALAVRWAHDSVGFFPDGQLYVNLRGYEPGQPVTAGDALAGFLRALGMFGSDIPAAQEERAACYRSMLAGRRMLVLLDNARDADQVRPLLPGTPGSVAVVTSRDALPGFVARDGARRLELDVLPLADAVELLRSLIGARASADQAATAQLVSLCARLPLALRIAAELAAARPQVPLSRLAAELAAARLDGLDTGDVRANVRGVFSWSLRQLPDGVARAFALIGLHLAVST
jgi:hypothetical protein